MMIIVVVGLILVVGFVIFAIIYDKILDNRMIKSLGGTISFINKEARGYDHND
jgi:hypothetical protein